MREPGGLWRLHRSADLTVSECFVDPLPNGQWVVNVWEGEVLVVSEQRRDRLTAVRVANRVRRRLLANGWTGRLPDPRLDH
jgi:hypothetical protein